MQLYDFSDKTLLLLGDLHGDFKLLINRLKDTDNQCKDVVFLICGDCGFGFNKNEYYNIYLVKLQKLLSENGNILIFLRGNHDDKSYFKHDANIFSHENIIWAEDYSVLKTKYYNSLLVGGAVSLDRSWRIKETERINKYRPAEHKKSIYWEDEIPMPNESLIDNLNTLGIKINSIISHSMPLDIFRKNEEDIPNALRLTTYFENDWFKQDDKLHADVLNEWQVLHKIYDDLTKNGHNIDIWVCGHYHYHTICYQNKEYPTMFVILKYFNHIPNLNRMDIYNKGAIGLVKPIDELKKLSQQDSLSIIKMVSPLGRYHAAAVGN